jgi:hypothetical protein
MLHLVLAVIHVASPTPQVPLRSPQLAVSGKQVALAYGVGHAIYVVTSSDEGQSFSKPVKVAEPPILPLTRHRGPRVVFSNGAIVVTAVTGKMASTGPHAHGLPSDGDLFAWRSTDGGKSWEAAIRINDVPSAAREGLHTLASDGRGRLFAAWLDLRKKGTRLYGSWSDDSGKTWSSNTLLYESPDGTICQCCHPTAVFTEDGALELMWRNVLGGARDLYLIRASRNRSFEKPVKLGSKSWMINACPMDGGGLTRDGSRTITAWRRGTEVFTAQPGKPEIRLGDGKDVAIAASAGRTYVAWVRGAELVSWIDGKSETLANKAAYPSLAALSSGGVVAAWEENGGVTVRTLR